MVIPSQSVLNKSIKVTSKHLHVTLNFFSLIVFGSDIHKFYRCNVLTSVLQVNCSNTIIHYDISLVVRDTMLEMFSKCEKYTTLYCKYQISISELISSTLCRLTKKLKQSIHEGEISVSFQANLPIISDNADPWSLHDELFIWTTVSHETLVSCVMIATSN